MVKTRTKEYVDSALKTAVVKGRRGKKHALDESCDGSRVGEPNKRAAVSRTNKAASKRATRPACRGGSTRDSLKKSAPASACASSPLGDDEENRNGINSCAGNGGANLLLPSADECRNPETARCSVSAPPSDDREKEDSVDNESRETANDAAVEDENVDCDDRSEGEAAKGDGIQTDRKGNAEEGPREDEGKAAKGDGVQTDRKGDAEEGPREDAEVMTVTADTRKAAKGDGIQTDGEGDAEEGPREDTEVMIVTADTRNLWRQCLKDVQSIYIPHVGSVRPKKTRNAFVTRAVVLLAYLIVNAEEGKPVPKIPPKFQFSKKGLGQHKMAQMEQELLNSGLNYDDPRMSWNRHVDVNAHIGSCTHLGSWLANTRNKAKYHGTWNIVDVQVVGSTKGLYGPYRDLLMKMGFNVPLAMEST